MKAVEGGVAAGRKRWAAIAVQLALLSSPWLVAQAGEGAEAELARAAMERDTQTVRELVKQGVDVNMPGQYDTPALHWIVRLGDVETAKLLLEAGADPNLKNAYGVGPLHLAITNNDAAMVRLLLDAGSDPSLADRTGESPLFLAARGGSLEVATALLDHGAAVDEREPTFAQTPLMAAVREGNVGIAALLIERGADVNAQSRSGEVPHWRRPEDNRGSKGVGIVRGGWPERGERHPVPGAKTPLLYATRQGHLEMTQLLVEAGAQLELADANTVTPLLNAILNSSTAARRGQPTDHLAVAYYLIEQGANIHVLDWYGQSPLWLAIEIRNQNVTGANTDNRIDREAFLELARVLLEMGADPNVRTREHAPERRFVTRLGDLSWVDFTGQTPFLRAAFSGDLSAMRLLLEHGADPNISTYAGTTPLMAAAGVNWVVNQSFAEGPEALLEAVRLTHELGNDVNAINSMGLTAVHGAANRGSDDIIRYLAEHGAALDIADKQGRTPVVWAEGVFLATHPPVNRPETVALLESLKQRANADGGRASPKSVADNAAHTHDLRENP